jgi:hypothetical protein
LVLESILTWIANHVGSTFFKNWTGVRKDLVDTEKAKLEITKLEEEAKEKAKQTESLITPASFDDVKNYDPKYKKITDNVILLELEKLKARVEIEEQRILVRSIADKIRSLLLVLVLLYELIRMLFHFVK